MDKNSLLNMNSISKEFSGVRALDDVSFDLRAGEVHGLVGENGAGKSTLIKVLGGVYMPDSGEIFINGEKMNFASANDSLKNGVGIIYQEFNLVPTLSIAENIYLGKELKKHGLRIDRKSMIKNCNEYMKKMGFGFLDCGQCVSELSVAQQQIVEIVKALFNKSKILVMDEPTAVLTEEESRKLFKIIEKLKSEGVGIFYISHRLEEVLELSDRITVLRDGKHITTLDNQNKDVSKKQLVNLMVGRDLDQYFPKRENCIGDEVVFEVKNLTKKGVFKDISFNVKRGEIFGITGLVGAGRTEVIKSIFGALKYDSGEIYLDGKQIQIRDPYDAIEKGIAFISENRKEEGLLLDSSIADNMILANLNKVSKKGIVRNKLKKEFVNKYFTQLDIRPNEPLKLARNFSGGNQQKSIVAKWIATNPRILIVDEPTRGIDIGAKAEIYKLLNKLVEQGLSVIMVSSEMPEVIGMCDRIMVMWEGKITGEFSRSDGYTQESIMAASSGIM